MERKFSNYYETLSPEAQKLYREKLSLQLENNETVILPDPFACSAWIDDPTKWPDVQFGDIYNFLIYTTGTYTHEHLKAYKSLEGYNFFHSGHVQVVQYYSDSEIHQQHVCYLKAKVIPSQRVTKKPYEAWICTEDSGKVVCAHCQCMAGLGQVCVHVAAILFKVEAAVKLGFTTRSSTSEACQWNKQFRKEISMCAVADMGRDMLQSNRKTPVASVSSSSRDHLPDVETLAELKRCCPDAVFFTLIPKLDDDDTDTAEEDDTSSPIPLITGIGDEIATAAELRSDEEALDLYRKECSQSKIEELEIKTRNQSSCFLWHLHRKGRITGTTVHSVLHRSGDKSADKLVSRIMCYQESDISNLKPVKWGSENEAVAFTKYNEQMQDKHVNFVCRKVGLVIDNTDVYLGASADGIVCCECHGKGTVEIKCPYKHRDVHPLTATHRDKNFCLSSDGKLKTGHKHYSQIQLQMHVNKVQYCDFVVYTTVSLHVSRIEYDQPFCAKMVAECRQFWFSHVMREIRTHKILKDSKAATATMDEICTCCKPACGNMIRCSVDSCSVMWYHCTCVGMERAPPGDWVCEKCRLHT